MGVRVGDRTVRCLFFADDGLLISGSVGEAEEQIRVLEEVGRYYGLNIHKGKSKVLIFNREQQPSSVGGIKVEKKFRYLGLDIEHMRDLFRG